MAGPKLIEGARALLFERLTDNTPGEPFSHKHKRILDQAALRASVQRELLQLLNTRCAVSLELIGETERTVINYGVPDFSSLSPHSSHDQKLVAAILTQTITAFEPRLRNVQVTVDGVADYRQALQVTVRAELVSGIVSEPVNFAIMGKPKSGDWKPYEPE